MIDFDILKYGDFSIYLAEKPYDINQYLEFLSTNMIKTVAVLIPSEDLEVFYEFNLLNRYRESGLKVIHFPIEDFSVPDDMSRFNDFIITLDREAAVGNILIHCSAGIGRTGLTAAALEMRRTGEYERSLDNIREIRWGAVETEVQENFLRSYLSFLQSD